MRSARGRSFPARSMTAITEDVYKRQEERGVKTDDSKEMSEADCRELWKLIKEMEKEFREMKQIADEWLMVNGRKDGCLGAVFAAMLLPAGAIYGIWSLF